MIIFRERYNNLQLQQRIEHWLRRISKTTPHNSYTSKKTQQSTFPIRNVQITISSTRHFFLTFSKSRTLKVMIIIKSEWFILPVRISFISTHALPISYHLHLSQQGNGFGKNWTEMGWDRLPRLDDPSICLCYIRERFRNTLFWIFC